MNDNGKQRAAEVRATLILRGLSLKDLAATAGVSRRMLAYVLRGQRSSARVQAAVAEFLGMDYRELWGPGPGE